jgi:TPR repeat protein
MNSISNITKNYDFYLYDYGQGFVARPGYQKMVISANSLQQSLCSFGKPIVYLSPKQMNDLPQSIKANRAFIDFLQSSALLVSKENLPEEVAKEVTKCEMNRDKALKLLFQSASRGFAQAQFSLGVCYDNGCGVPMRPQEAVSFYERAANQGHELARFNLVALHALQGDPQAQYELGMFFEEGAIIKSDLGRAITLYKQSAEQGITPAQVRLGLCNLTGKGVVQNHQEAKRLFQQASDNGDAAGSFNLASCYAHGQGVEKDLDEAARLVKIAADKGLNEAKIVLRRIEHHSEETIDSPPKRLRISEPS